MGSNSEPPCITVVACVGLVFAIRATRPSLTSIKPAKLNVFSRTTSPLPLLLSRSMFGLITDCSDRCVPAVAIRDSCFPGDAAMIAPEISRLLPAGPLMPMIELLKMLIGPVDSTALDCVCVPTISAPCDS